MLIALAALFVSAEAHAYVGPGAGLSAIGSVLALIGGALMLILGFAWYPIKRLYRRWKSRSAPGPERESGDSSN
jgi:hypothetical protein